MLPGFQFFHEEVVALGDLGQFGIHSSFEVNEVLPSLHGISGVLVAFSNDFIKMSHGNLGHEWLLDRASEDSLHAGVASL